jgi:hypothetical protein
MTRLELLRRSEGLTQAALGDKILYSPMVISQLERLQLTPETVGKRLRRALEDYFSESLESLLQPIEGVPPLRARQVMLSNGDNEKPSSQADDPCGQTKTRQAGG